MKLKRQRPLLISILLVVFIIAGPFYLLKYRPEEMDYNKTRNQPDWVGIIDFWDYSHFDQKTGTQYGWIYEKIELFEKKHPGVYINFTPLTREEGPAKLENAIKTGTMPDIAPAGNSTGIIGKGVLEPLNDYLTQEEIKDFREGVLDGIMHKGQILAMPWMISTYAMILNIDLFQERGIEPPENGNWTYEEFIEKLKALTFSSKGNREIDHFGFHGFISHGYYNTWGILLSDGAQIFDEEMNYKFNDQRALNGVKRLIDLKQKYGVTPPGFGENIRDEAWVKFYRDKNIAVYPAGTWALNRLELQKKEGTGFEYTVANFPKGSIKKPAAVGSIESYGVFKQEEAKKKEMCISFIKFLADHRFQLELNRLNVFPVRKSAGNIYEEDILMSKVYENLENIVVIPHHPYWNEIDKIIQNEIRQGILGKKSPEQLLKDAEEKAALYLNRTKD